MYNYWLCCKDDLGELNPNMNVLEDILLTK